VLDIPTIADVMFDNAEHKKGQSRSADEARYNVSISCYILLSRLADLSVRGGGIAAADDGVQARALISVLGGAARSRPVRAS